MFSLLITIISIALALILVLAVLYYGSEAFGNHADKVVAETLLNQSVQISSALQVARSQGIPVGTGESVSLPPPILSSMPVPPKSAYASDTPAPDDWKYYVPGSTSYFGLQAKLSKRSCMAVNKLQGFIGIPAVWDGANSVQCFGTGPDTYTYLYQPGSQTGEQHDAVLDKSLNAAKPTYPDAKPGYPRLCPDDTTITEGVCPGGTDAGGGTPTSPDTGRGKQGFWVITASSWLYPDDIVSEGFFDSCPADAINPTTAAAHPAPSAPGEQFNIDGVVESGWTGPPAYDDIFTTKLVRKYCLPAHEADVVNVGSIVDMTYGDTVNPVFSATPASPRIDSYHYHGAGIAAVTVTADNVKWTILAATAELDVVNPDNGDERDMRARKIAIGKNPDATETYFLASPTDKPQGVTYQYLSATVTFDKAAPTKLPPPPPHVCDDKLNITSTGAGGTIVDIKGDSNGAVILKSDGSVWGTGSNYYGILGICHEEPVLTWTRLATSVTAIDFDWDQPHLYLTKTDGSLWMSGKVWEGEAGPAYPQNFDNLQFIKIADSNVTKAGGSSFYSAYLKDDGSIWFAGYSAYGEGGTGTYRSMVSSFSPVDSGAVTMFATYGDIYYLKGDRSLWASGATHDYHLGYWDDSLTTGSPKKIANDVVKAKGTMEQLVYLTSDGRAFAAGADTWGVGMFGQGDATSSLTAFTQLIPAAGPFVDVAVTPKTIMLLGADGRLWASGANEFGYFGDGTTNNTVLFKNIAVNVAKFTPGGMYVDRTGALWGTGDNSFGNYGDGTTATSLVWKQLSY